MKMYIRLYRVAVLMAMGSLFLLAGCSSIRPDSSLERNWNRAYETQLNLQQANPEAGRQVRPVMEMDGASVDRIMEAHRKSFENGDHGHRSNRDPSCRGPGVR
jgi:hypothetical protein